MHTMKLFNFTSDYQSFADNQLLTAAQLNLLIHYLDNQDRLSRLSLTGAGILCGLELSYQDESLTISQGTALTTDGDLIKLRQKNPSEPNFSIAFKEKSFVAYIPFSHHQVAYPHFLTKEAVPLPIFELLDAEKAETFRNSKPLGSLNLKEYVVFLYLENYTQPDDICRQKNCDSQGIPEVSRLRYFLIHQEVVKESILPQDSIFRQFQESAKIPRIELLLDRIPAASLIRKSKIDLDRYNSVCKNFESLFNIRCRALFRHLQENLDIQLPKSLTFQKSYIPRLFPNAQYNYDHLSDLVHTYNEIRECALRLDSICNHELRAFPKHIMLGAVSDSTFRHAFYKSPALANTPSIRPKIESLLRRFETKRNAYSGNYGQEIHLNPSRSDLRLSYQAIPAYYDRHPSLFDQWTFGLSRTDQEHLNREARLEKDLSRVNFIRIEGIFQKNWALALQEIQEKRSKYGLTFDILCLHANGEGTELKDEYPASFQDLRTHLSAWKAQQNCLFETAITFLSGFSTKEKGGHNHIQDFFLREKGKDITMASYTPREEVSFREEVEKNSPIKEVTEVKEVEAYKEVDTFKPMSYASMKSTPIVYAAYQPEYHYTEASYDTSSAYFPIAAEKEDIGLAFGDFNLIEAGSYHDFVAHFDQEVVNVIADIATWDTTDRKLRVTYPTHLIAAIRALLNQVPSSIQEINTEQLKAYQQALDTLCEKVNTVFNFINTTVNDPESDYIRQGFEDHYLAILNRLKDNCCAGDFLTVILSETLQRKKNILEETSFLNFVKKHPGLEHRAGVPIGGTFVLLYEGKSNRVVADFALPYQCCSKNSPIAFMVTPPVEKEPDVHFDITPIACLSPEDSLKIPFELHPEGASIQLASEAIKGLRIEKNTLLVDPGFSDFERPIQFRSNRLLLEKTITIVQKNPLSLRYEFDEASKTYTIYSSIFSEKFQWHVNGKKVKSKDSEKLNITEDFSEEFTVSLFLNTRCGEDKAQLSINPQKEEEEASISFSIPPTICKDLATKIQVDFNLSPKDTPIELAKNYPGLSIQDQHLLISAAFTAFNTPIEFLVNGNLSKQSIQVLKQEQLRLEQSYNPENKTYIITSTVSTKEFQWTLNGEKIAADSSTELLIRELSEEKNVILLQLKTPCGPASASLTLDQIRDQEPDCTQQALTEITNTKSEIQKILKNNGLEAMLSNDLGMLLDLVQKFEKNPGNFVQNSLPDLDMARYTFEGLYYQMQDSNEPKTLALLYGHSLKLLHAMLRCVPAKQLDEFEWVFAELFGGIAGHLKNSSLAKSLTSIIPHLTELIQFRISKGSTTGNDPFLRHLSTILEHIPQV